MARLTPLTLLSIPLIAAQLSLADQYIYLGCATITASSFPQSVNFFVPFTSQQCRSSCEGYAAVGSSCACNEPGSPEPLYELVDEALCSRPCIEDQPEGGVCGGDNGEVSLYQRAEDGVKEEVQRKAEKPEEVLVEGEQEDGLNEEGGLREETDENAGIVAQDDTLPLDSAVQPAQPAQPIQTPATNMSSVAADPIDQILATAAAPYLSSPALPGTAPTTVVAVPVRTTPPALWVSIAGKRSSGKAWAGLALLLVTLVAGLV
ncbi:hypothetical protein S40285_03304 [Stachybotrys chlorohalonatus IBT 40285]|uniref:WSC domain-containing protein n=1 Tax=Stachybotrys chlorohalonatus (strain IBT 40285) TaxID=1283841 RepID=A0A084R1K5_STAC4|nr:hypothetical protein S40285_03304 [Stachybotrys chlorohalonata IBT 40285]